MGFIESTAAQRFEASLAVYDQFARLYRTPAEIKFISTACARIRFTALLQKITHFPRNNLLTIHSQEKRGRKRVYRERNRAISTALMSAAY
jgi:hypothetical protein